jgi:hypothetical protein
MIRARITLPLVVVLAGCGSSPNILPTNDFNRPTDVQFMCFGAFGDDVSDLQLSGRPMRACHPSGQLNMFTNASDDGIDPGPGLETRTFALMPNSASGDLSLIDADNWRIVDLGTANAGYGRVPLGAVPEQISVSQDGCRLISANRGSCDLTLIDPSVYVQPVLQAEHDEVSIAAPEAPVTAPQAPVDGNQKPLEVSPYEVAFLPQDTSQLNGKENLCQHDGAQAVTTPWRVLVTYPSCDLVALVDMPSFEIVDSVKVTLVNGLVVVVPQGKTPVCPISDCGTGRMDPVAAPPQTRPSALAIVPAGDRAYVGLSSAPFILSLPVDAAAGTIGATGNAIPLHDGAVGSNRIRLGVDPYRYKVPDDRRVAGTFVGDDKQRRFLYAIARDGTVAVIDVLNPGAERECETNVDPLNPPAGTTRGQACIPPDPLHRRPGADGPALRFPTAPVDVAAADIPFQDDSDRREESVGGGYAWVLTASGVIYLVNIDPVLRQFTAVARDGDVYVANTVQDETEPYVNTVRDRNQLSYSLALDPSSGPPRVDVAPVAPVGGPYIEPFWTKGTADDATALDVGFRATSIFFHDRSVVTPQSWSVTWQGAIVGPRYAGRLLFRDSKMVLQDDGVDFCYSGPGVIKGDVVTIGGCTKDEDCGAGLACLKDDNVDVAAGGLPVNGLCVNELDRDRLEKDNVCADFIRTVRRYEVVAARGQTLDLVPHLDEVIRSSLKACRIPPATPQTPPAPNDCADPADPATASYFTCQRDPLGGAAPRCLKQCEMDADCRQGRICQILKDVNGAEVVVPDPADPSKTIPAKFCADAPPFTAGNQTSCFYQLVPYDVRVGRGFLVSGSNAGIPGSGTKIPEVGGPNGATECASAPRTDPSLSDYRQVSRIAIDGPGVNLCAPELNNFNDSRPRPDFDLIDPNNVASAIKDDSDTAEMLARVKSNPTPNPCLFMGGPVETDPPFDPNVLANQRPQHVRALFQNTEISFILANLDRAPPAGLEIRFDVRGGFRPQTVIQQSTIEISMPTRIVLGPIDSQPQDGTVTNEVPYLFVVDQRRLGLGLGGGPTRGQLLRIHPLGYTSSLTTAGGLQPIYDDYTRSNGLFPVQ